MKKAGQKGTHSRLYISVCVSVSLHLTKYSINNVSAGHESLNSFSSKVQNSFLCLLLEPQGCNAYIFGASFFILLQEST